MKYTVTINDKKIIVPNFLTNEGRQFIFRRIFAKSSENYLVPNYNSSDTDRCSYAFNFIDADSFIGATVNDTLKDRQWKFFNPNADLTTHSVWLPLFQYISPNHASFHSDSIGTLYDVDRDGGIIGIALVADVTRQFPITLISIGLFNGVQAVKTDDRIYVGYELAC